MRLNPRLLALPLALLGVFLVYGRSLDGGYVFDDHHFVENNAAIRDLSNAPRFFYDPSTQSSVENLNADVYRPLTTLSFAADYAVAGADPAYSRAVNLALHAAAAALLFWLALLAGLSAPYAAAAAAFFALFPAGVEAVSWISGRSAAMSAVFIFSSLGFFLKGVLEGGRRHFLISSLFCAAALFTREVSAVLPLLALGWLAAARLPLKKHLAQAGLYLALPAALFILLRFLVLGKLQQVAAPAFSPGVLASLPFVLFAKYAEALLYPFSMLVTYSDIVELRLNALAFYLPFSAAVCLLYAGLAAALRARGEAVAAWGLLWVPLCLLPVLNIVPITVYMAERFLYLPAAGLGLALAAGASALRGNKREWAVFAAFGALLLLFAVNIQGRLAVWRNDVSLWSYDAQKNPQNFVTRMRLAEALLAAGDRQGAYGSYQLALGLARSRGQLAVALNEIGSMHAAAKELKKAEGFFAAAASYKPDSHLVFYNLGKVRFLRGDQRGARRNLERSLELKKNYAPALELLSHLGAK